jgi:hypothetical protein
MRLNVLLWKIIARQVKKAEKHYVVPSYDDKINK